LLSEWWADQLLIVHVADVLGFFVMFVVVEDDLVEQLAEGGI